MGVTVREESHIDFVDEKRHMDVLLETLHPPLPLETSRTFFDFAEAPVALSILQGLRLITVVYKSIKIHRQSQNLIMSIRNT